MLLRVAANGPADQNRDHDQDDDHDHDYEHTYDHDHTHDHNHEYDYDFNGIDYDNITIIYHDHDYCRNRDHEHDVLEGKETTKSSKYRIKFAQLVHKSFLRAIHNAGDRFTDSQ